MTLFNEKERHFNFRCEKCKEILTSSFEDPRDIEDVVEGQLWLQCLCGGKASLFNRLKNYCGIDKSIAACYNYCVSKKAIV